VSPAVTAVKTVRPTTVPASLVGAAAGTTSSFLSALASVVAYFVAVVALFGGLLAWWSRSSLGGVELAALLAPF
jgi:1,4-dihydroxy-2-naphthoate octaprenyltransferase